MKRKGISWSNRYKRFFLDENTALIAASASILILPVNYYFGTHSGGIDPAGLYDLLMRLVLVCTLLYSLKTHKLLLMQAATVHQRSRLMGKLYVLPRKRRVIPARCTL